MQIYLDLHLDLQEKGNYVMFWEMDGT
jgi:hypothetical protein